MKQSLNRPACRHGLLETDHHVTIFEYLLVFLIAIDVIILVYYIVKLIKAKLAYDVLAEKVDEEMSSLKHLQDTTSMQVAVPILFVRKWKKAGDPEATASNTYEDRCRGTRRFGKATEQRTQLLSPEDAGTAQTGQSEAEPNNIRGLADQCTQFNSKEEDSKGNVSDISVPTMKKLKTSSRTHRQHQ